MWNSTLLLIFSFLLICGIPAWAGDIVVIRSSKIKPYDDALRGFKSVFAGKSDGPVFYEQDTGGDVRTDVRRMHPDLVLAIGMDALAKSRSIKNVPLIYLMVLNPQPLVHGSKNITGVSMSIAPDKQFAVLRKTLPGIRKIGLLYNPRRNDFNVKKNLSSARAHGFELIAKEVYRSKDVPRLLENFNGKIDVLWVLPDMTVATPEAMASIFIYSVEKKVPIHIFSSKYLEMGALTSLDPNPFDMGRQAGEMAAKVFSGVDISEIAAAEASNPVLSINTKAAKKLDIAINAEMLRKARAAR